MYFPQASAERRVRVLTLAKIGHTHSWTTLRMRNLPACTVVVFSEENTDFYDKNNKFNKTIQAICCFALISKKWIGRDLFNDKWDYEHNLNEAKN